MISERGVMYRRRERAPVLSPEATPHMSCDGDKDDYLLKSTDTDLSERYD